MELTVPEYIEARIRQRPPHGVPVVRGSTPVVAFGDMRQAEVATLGLNPSKREFLDKADNELAERRLETLASLRECDLAVASPSSIGRVYRGCSGYFQLRPYKRWFGKLERLLGPLGKSYYGGTACHLDLTQWATDPTWGNLGRTVRETMIEADLPFLRLQLEQEQIRLLLLNGTGVATAFSQWFDCDLAERAVPGKPGWRIFDGSTARGVRVIGWNKNLQSTPGVSNEDIAALAGAIQRAISP